MNYEISVEGRFCSLDETLKSRLLGHKPQQILVIGVVFYCIQISRRSGLFTLALSFEWSRELAAGRPTFGNRYFIAAAHVGLEEGLFFTTGRHSFPLALDGSL